MTFLSFLSFLSFVPFAPDAGRIGRTREGRAAASIDAAPAVGRTFGMVDLEDSATPRGLERSLAACPALSGRKYYFRTNA
jgi:hypothetical protein